MYIIKNSFKNLKRNKSRNLMIAAIIFAIVLTTVISMVINSTASSVIDDYKDKFGSEVFLTPNFEKIREQSKTDSEGGMMMAMTMPELNTDLYLKFAKSKHLKNSVITGTTNTSSNDIKGVDEKDETDSGNGFMAFDDSVFTLLGDKYAEFDEGTRKLASGSLPKNKNEALISSEVSKLNKLSLGDSFKLTSEVSVQIPDDIDKKTLKDGDVITVNNTKYTVKKDDFGAHLVRSVDYDLKVVGIYDDLNPEYANEGMPKIALFNRRNEIITPLDTLLQHRHEGENGIYISATYYLNNPESLEAFEAEIRELGLPDTFNVGTDEYSYNAIVKPVEGLKKITTSFMYVVFILGSIILILLTSISIGERKYEIGVLRAMGMKKNKLAFGLWFEMFTMTVICLIIGIGVGTMVAQPVSDILLKTQASSNNMNQIGGSSSPQFNVSVGMGSDNSNSDVTKIEIALDMNTIIQIIAISILLTTIASLVSMRKITQYEPIKILMERN